MSELSNIPTEALLAEVLGRQDELLTKEGLLWRQPFALADFLSTRVCVDGIPVRRNHMDETELMAIRRSSGPYTGKLCLVGGGVGRIKENGQWMPESFEQAISRHFKTDLGYEVEAIGSWDCPQLVAQDMRPVNGSVKEGFMPNPNSRHLVAARFLVTIVNESEDPVFGKTELGGQEASGVEWFTESTMPTRDEFGYDHGLTYATLFPIAQKLST